MAETALDPILPGECSVDLPVEGRVLTFEVVEVVGGVKRDQVEVHVRHRGFRGGKVFRAVVPCRDIACGD